MEYTYSLLFLLIFYGECEAKIKYPPVIVSQPVANEELLFQVVTRQDENEKPFVIECEADGVPTPTYRWIKNGKPFDWQAYDDRMSQQPGRGTLVITSPRTEDLGQYQCFATNELGTASSNSVFVRKSLLNNFKYEQPRVETVNEGDPYGLACQPPDGYPPPVVHWMIRTDGGTLLNINNTRMTVDPEGTLWFTNVTRHDESTDSTYACAAYSTFRNEYKIGNKVYLKVAQTGSTSVQLRNPPEPQFLSRRNHVVLRGKQLRLYCIFSGTPLPEMIWRKSNGFIDLTRVEYADYGKTLVLLDIDFEDTGQYECQASNGVGEAKTHTMNVLVQAIPYFTKEPEIQNKAEEETAIFECEALGRPPPEIWWIYNGRSIDQDIVRPNRIVENNRIIVYNLTRKDIGNYGCNATNDYGYVYKDVYLNVLALKPEIREPPPDVRAVVGKKVALTCGVFGAPKPRISWFRNQQEVTGGRYIITEDGTLVIKDTAFTDAGGYTCVAKNKYGEEVADGSLVVKDKTRITDAPEDYEVPAGSTATFRCNAVADPDLQLSIDWLVEDKKIDFELEPRFVQQTDYSLSITKTTELDSSTYTCLASTEIDEVRASAKLTVQDVPNPPQLDRIECEDHRAKVTWKPAGDNRAPILGYVIQFNTSFTPDTWEDAFDIYIAPTSTTWYVPMSPWANYTFRVIATNKIGPSLPSSHSTVCTTPYDVPYKNPEGVEGRGTTPSNLVIRWSPMPEIEHNGPGFKYHVFYRRNDLPFVNFTFHTVDDWWQDHYVLDGQPTFKPYLIKVEAFNEEGQSKQPAKEVVGWSGEDRPLTAPTGLTVEKIIDATSAVLTWKSVPLDSIRGHFQGYKIRTWTKDENPDQARELIIVPRQGTKVLISSFIPFTTNFAKVLVYNSAFDGPESSETIIETPEGTPGPIDSLEAIPMGSSAFYLVWKEPKQKNGNLTGYSIYYQQVIGTYTGPLSERDPSIDDPLMTRAKLAGLKPNTKYRIIVKARTKIGKGEPYYIERKTNSDDEAPLGKPLFIYQKLLDREGPPAIKITWIPNIESNPGSHFFVQYRKYGESVFERTKDEMHQYYMILEGLEHSRYYEIRLVAVDGDRYSYSDIKEVDTYLYGPVLDIVPHLYDSFAIQPWFISMIILLIIFAILFAIVWLAKFNRDKLYSKLNGETTHGLTTDSDGEPSYPEYAHPGGSGEPTAGADMPYTEHETEFTADYTGHDAEIDEDGSFIGEYGHKKTAEPQQQTGFATLV